MSGNEWMLGDAELTIFARTVRCMRDLGVVQAFGIILGPEPKAPTKLESLQKAVAEEDSPKARRDLRVENAREELRAKIGNWDISNERLDAMLDPAIFELE